MENLLVLFAILIVTSPDSRSEAETSKVLNRYVTPNRTVRCLNDQVPCNTIEEYARQPHTYFTNNTHFYFQPGSHQLNSSIRLRNIQNLTFQGLPGGEILFGSYVSIVWEKCSNIRVSSIVFTLLGNFTYSIQFRKTQLIHLSDISVIGNEHIGYIGYSSILSQQSTVSINNSKFVGIHGWVGAALMISTSNVTFTGKNTFIDNVASAGGCMYMRDSVLMLNGTNLFMNNTSNRQYGYLDKICARKSFYNNRGGGVTVFICFKATAILDANNYFAQNISNFDSGGAISAQKCRIFIGGFTSFHSNSAHVASGGAMVLKDVSLEFCGNISFENNSATYGGALHILNTNISFNVNDIALMTCHSSETSVTFRQNKATQVGGAIESHFNNTLIFTGKVFFIDNSAFNGGAIGSFETSSLKMILVPILNISFLMNHADDTGGALYFRDSQCLIGSRCPLECFISVMNHGSCAIRGNILLHFEHNSAGSVGSTLYGGHLSECRIYFRNTYELNLDIRDTKLRNDSYSTDALGVFISISRIIQYEESVINISSPANKLNRCDQYWWSDVYYVKVHPGEKFNITLKATAQIGYPVPANILIDNSYSRGDRYRISPLNQNINATCTNASFQLYSSREEEHVSITLYPENPCHSLVDGLKVNIYILPCPIGFQLSNNYGKCVCNKKVQKFTPNCYIGDTSFERIRNNFWISQTNSTELIIHESRCPLDYCTNSPVNVTVMYSDQSVQCDFNRSGTVCGQCLKNFSLALGSLHCIPCDNNHAALIVFFAFAGIALITLIFLLRLTVAVGTLSGLLFYANIIQANQQAFFPRATINPFTIFISWLNLDLGIETCFYEGMDIYAYSWFQFLFPFYVWFLIGCIIMACHYSQSIAKRLGHNPVAVLATLLLMSYSKILQAIIFPLSLTYLTYYSNSASESYSTVWLYDASIHFFREPKHIALGVFAIFSLVILVIPYIFLLLFGQWLQGCSNRKILSWLNKIKPFMDAYHAPYKKHTRYWTGLLLLSRLGLFLTFAINANSSESINILTVSSVSIALLAIKGRVYEHWCKDFIESSFILNLGIFSVATFYLKEESEDDKSQFIVSSISVGIAFVTFIGILLFHISLVLKSSNIWKLYMLPFIQKSLFFSTIFRITYTPTKDYTTAGDSKTTELHVLPTATEINVDLREPLLEIIESQAPTNN